MIARVLILIIIALQTFHGIGQSDSTRLNKMIEKHITGKLDSVYTEIKVFKDQFNRIENSRWFYIYKDTLFDSLGNYSIGNFIIEPHGNFDGRKIGVWTRYYSNDSIMSIGKYDIGATTWCQSLGPSVSGYSIKTGEWKYYYSNGQIKARGVFQLEASVFQNNCGGDARFLSKTNDKWFFFDKSGIRIENAEEIINEIKGI